MVEYARPSLTTDAVVLAGEGEDMQLLVVKRKKDPFKGQLSFPGGFVESMRPTWKEVLRELREETGLELRAVQGHPLELREMKGRDPRGWTLSLPYLFWLPGPLPVKGGDDAAEAFWVPLRELTHLSFDHGAILCEALGKFWSLVSPMNFPQPPLGLRVPPDLSLKAQANKAKHAEVEGREWILFGGSFNPWHLGHEACIRAASAYGTVVVIPDRNPFKDFQGQRCYFQFYQELCEKVAPLKAMVYPGFCGQERPNPTYQWWPRWGQIQGEARFSLLMGDDSFLQLDQWAYPETFLSRVHRLYIVPRVAKSSQIEEVCNRFKGVNLSNKLVQLPDHPYKDWSSTKLREKSD